MGWDCADKDNMKENKAEKDIMKTDIILFDGASC